MPKRHRSIMIVIGLTLLSLSYAQSGLTQTPEELKAVRKELEALKEGQAAIQKDLQDIKNLLRARTAPGPVEPQSVVLSVEGAPFKGDQRAKVTLIDFSDYQ